jgi:alkanesulfonate monooxygenase SsuD/methylene tetrahydromethanopterin reductase-like flavin-dependent oxidoreductase (luciferase family)
MELATLAHAYPGRLTGGVGLGVPSWVDRMGLLPGKPARFMSDYLGVMRRLLAGEQVTAELEGTAYRLADIKLAHPVEGGIPLAIGAVGELMLKIAGRAADVAIISTLASPKYVAWAREVTESAAKQADRAAPARVCFVSTSIHADAAEARRLIRHDLAFVLGAMGVCALTTPLGIDDDLREFLARPEPLAELMPDEWVDEMAIVGTKNDLVGRVHDYIESGATELVFSPKPATRTLEVLTAVSDALALR